jgi:FtsP/CotA-like multicopper oxidase with cupredoxin domain
MQPGERYEVVMDFSAFAGKTLILSNSARTPYPKGAPPQGSTVGRILQFRVSKTAAGTPFNPAIALRTGTNAIVRLANPVTGTLGTGVTVNKTRAVTLNEHLTMPVTATNPVTGALTKFPGGPTEILVNNTLWDGYRIDELTGNRIPIPNYTPDGIGNYLSEVPTEGETEVWEIINLTMDAHPIHLHLVQFQIMNRQAFNVSNYMKAYGALFPANPYQIDPATLLPYAGGVPIAGYGPPLNYNPSLASGQKYGGNPDVTLYLQGKVQPPAAYESGWKDTIIALPGMVTRIVVRWAPQGLAANSPVASNFFPFVPNTNGFDYVWHCHIIDHEDNEMMRPDQVTPNENAIRTYIMGGDY